MSTYHLRITYHPYVILQNPLTFISSELTKYRPNSPETLFFVDFF